MFSFQHPQRRWTTPSHFLFSSGFKNNIYFFPAAGQVFGNDQQILCFVLFRRNLDLARLGLAITFLSCQAELETTTTPGNPKSSNPYCKYSSIIGLKFNYCYSSNKNCTKGGYSNSPWNFLFSDFYLRAASHKLFPISGIEDTVWYLKLNLKNCFWTAKVHRVHQEIILNFRAEEWYKAKVNFPVRKTTKQLSYNLESNAFTELSLANEGWMPANIFAGNA